MSKSDLAISVRGLSKEYSIVQNKGSHSTLAETLLSRLNIFSSRQPTERSSFRALNDVSFDVRKGEVVGVIGRNGAGKSTLLKILSRITDPSSGVIDLYGRVGSLLEVGTGFHPELTGRENIFLNGAILGMSRSEIHTEFDNIVEFAGVEKFLDTPVKRYSSGMYVRLAFAVAAHLRSEILVVDEVLAVGDAEFQKKCLGKIHDVACSGKTVLFVSHHMQSVASLCSSAIYMDRGELKFSGPVDAGICRYNESFDHSSDTNSAQGTPLTRPGTGEFRFTHVAPRKRVFDSGESVEIDFTISKYREGIGQYFVSATVCDQTGTVLVHCDARMVNAWWKGSHEGSGTLTIHTPWMRPGRYRANMWICNNGVLDSYEAACSFDVSELLPYDAPANAEATAHGIVFADFEYSCAG